MDNFLVKKMLVSTTKLRGANKNLDFFEYRVQKCDITKKKKINLWNYWIWHHFRIEGPQKGVLA